MAKRSFGQDRNGWNPSQIVAHNMTKARELRGMHQSEVAERMSRFTEAKWTQPSVAQAEGSVGGVRIRAFTAVELFALARTFDLPITYFLAPPESPTTARLEMPGVPPDAWQYLMMLVVGNERNAEFVGRQYAKHITTGAIKTPSSDASLEELESYTASAGYAVPLDPTDVMAAAFHGLMLTRTRGAPPAAGDSLSEWISVLSNLQFALEAFQGYKPGRFVNPKMAKEIAEQRERALERDRQAREDERRLYELEREQRNRDD